MKITGNFTKTLLVLTVLIVGTLTGLYANQAIGATSTAYMDPDLENRLSTAQDTDILEVIITHDGQFDTSQLVNMNIDFVKFVNLPMVGASLTPSQINEISTWQTVETMYFNQELDYLNYEASEITGTHTVHNTSGFTGSGVTVAVVDSGINGLHPDLEFGSKVIQNVKVTTTLGQAEPVYLENVANTDTTSGHGTHVSGIVGGTGLMSEDTEDNPEAFGKWLDGAAPGTSLVGLGAGEGLSILAALESFDWILSHHQEYDITVVTNSWGTSGGGFDPNNPINIASYELYTEGMTVLFAAGNDGPNPDTMNPYSLSPWVISVGAGNDAKQLTDFSSRGVAGDEYKYPDIVAPGNQIVSTKSQNTALAALGNDWNLQDDHEFNDHHAEYVAWYHSMSGTSMATPFVAGVVALIQEANPDLSPDQIIDIISQSGDDMVDANGEPYAKWEVGGGYINSETAIALAQSTTGDRSVFLNGDTEFSSQGDWETVDNAANKLQLLGGWRERTNGQYMKDANTLGGSVHYNPGFALDSAGFQFVGSTFKVSGITFDKGGLARVIVDNTIIDVVDTYSTDTQYRVNFTYTDFDPSEIHDVTIEVLGDHSTDSDGDYIVLDGIYVDGKVLQPSSELIQQTIHYEGEMGPSVGEVAATTENHYYNLSLDENALQVTIELSWDPAADLDLYLLDANGNVISSSASLANPELIKLQGPDAGDYTIQIKGYATVLTLYSLDITITSSQ